MSRQLTRTNVLAWNSNWSDADRRRITDELDRLHVVSFYEPASGGYIGGLDANGTKRMYIAPGYLWFARGAAPTDRELDWPGYEFSTFRGHASQTAQPERRSGEYCAVHFTELSVTGVCGQCD